jgi:hypothetical protein
MRKKNPMTEATISCKVSLGMFSNERGVLVELPDGRKISALVDKRHVIVDEDPKPGAEVEGRVKVSVVEPKKDSIIVDLPQPGLTEGPRLKVPKTFLR